MFVSIRPLGGFFGVYKLDTLNLESLVDWQVCESLSRNLE